MSIDFEFRKLVMDHHIGSDLIKYCYQCSRCADNCPVTRVSFDFYGTSGYNPRSNILNALLGYKDAIFDADPLVIWGCTVCDTCDEVCPQNIELTEIFTFLKDDPEQNILVLVGGFQAGSYSQNVLDLEAEDISIYPEGLETNTVLNHIVINFEHAIGI